MSINNWIEQNLLFSRKTRNGVFACIVLFLMTLGFQKIYNYYWRPEAAQIELSAREKIFISQAEENNSKRIEYQRYKRKKRKYTIPQTPFNPNDYELKDWEKIGFSEKQAQAIMNYQEKGFEFRVKKDVQKLFVVSDDLYKQLYPKIDLPDSIVFIKQEEKGRKDIDVQKKETKLNLNLANQEELKKLYGIGEKLSARILKYRNSLGGFVSLSQLNEIWGLSPETISSILPKVEIQENTVVTKLNINSSTEEMLKSHPYLDWRLASQIVKYRANHGAFKRIEDIQELVLIDQELFDKLAPYLTLE